jgi:hypothetical protein
MTTPSLLEELVFVPPSLNFTPPPASVNLSLEVPVKGSSRRLQWGMPCFLRQPPVAALASRWPAFCKRIRAHGIPMYCRAVQFEQLAASQLPIRLAKRDLGQPFDPQELRTADALEINCWHSGADYWQWPLELASPERLKTFVQAARDATSSLTPIGLSLPSGASNRDLDLCVEAECDFLTLVSTAGDSGGVAVMVEGLSRARELFQAAGVRLPVLVVLPIHQPEHVLKLLALGASAICVDGLLNPLIKAIAASASTLAGGMLSGLNLPIQEKGDMPEIETALTHLRQTLEACHRVHASWSSSDAELPCHVLRGTSHRACQLARVEFLGESSGR